MRKSAGIELSEWKAVKKSGSGYDLDTGTFESSMRNLKESVK